MGGQRGGAAAPPPPKQRTLPPRLRVAAQKNELRARQTQQRISEERKLRAATLKPGWRRERVLKLRNVQGRRARETLFREVYEHLDPVALREALQCVVILACWFLVGWLLQRVAQALTKTVIEVATSHTSISGYLRHLVARLLNLITYVLLSRTAWWLVVVWQVIGAGRAAYRYVYYYPQRQRLRATPQICAVCLDTVMGDDEGVREDTRTLICGHRFHEDCVGPWVAERRCCPLCRVACK
mmetsp:Transcript_125335/g.360058  ORF Transcript_125335/g.360058 Transcript_125335/m.360058 type:complete len:241 (-) Transcript_125335:4-726(-)